MGGDGVLCPVGPMDAQAPPLVDVASFPPLLVLPLTKGLAQIMIPTTNMGAAGGAIIAVLM